MELQQLFHLQEEDFDKLIPNSVFGIFDYKPRGIITVWDYIRNEFGEDSIMKASSLLSFLDKIIITNDYLKDHEKIIKDCVDVTQEEEGCKCHINYEMFRYYVYSKVQSVEVEDSETEKKKLMIQEQLIDVLQLFYFMEKLVKHSVVRDGKEEFDKENDDELGARYAELLNAILDIKDERRVYYNALTAVEVITLYNALSSVLSLKQQSEIYKSKELFKKYMEILDRADFKPLDNMYDYEWKQVLDKENELNNNISKEITSEVLRAFQGVDFDYSILDTREVKDLGEDLEKEKEIGRTDISIKSKDVDLKEDKFLDNMVKQLIQKRKDEAIIQNLKIKENLELEENKTDIKKKKLEEIEKAFIVRFKSLLDKSFLKSIKYYIEPNEEIFISNCSDEFHKYIILQNRENLSYLKEEWNADRVVSILSIVRLAVIKRRKRLDELDLLACANILNKQEDKSKPIKIYMDEELYEYIDMLENDSNEKIGKSRARELVKKLNDNKNNLDECDISVSNQHSIEQGGNTSKELIKTNIFKMFGEREKERNSSNNGKVNIEIACCIDEGENKPSAWRTRRKNTMIKLVKILDDMYIEQKCNEMLQDFVFINCIEMVKQPSSNSIDLFQYKNIQEYIFSKVKYFSKKKDYNFIKKGISFVKEQVIKQQETYKIHEINLESLNTIIRKSDSPDIRTESEMIKQRLLTEGKINIQTFDEFVERLEFYLKNRLEKENSFHVNSLKLLCDKLINKDQVIDCAEKLIDIEKEERKRIYQLELNSYVRAYKYHLERRESEKLEEKNPDTETKNPTQEA